MKALTLWQPYATAIALGVKRIETRPPWAMRLRMHVGERIGVHAAVKRPEPWQIIDGWRVVPPPTTALPVMPWRLVEFPGVAKAQDLPLGAVVATAVIEAVVEIDRYRYHTPQEDHFARQEAVRDYPAGLHVVGRGDGPAFIENERPWGNYERGRVAILLADVEPLDEPIPCRGFQQLWTLPDDVATRIGAA